jgi:hypothetical protein
MPPKPSTKKQSFRSKRNVVSRSQNGLALTQEEKRYCACLSTPFEDNAKGARIPDAYCPTSTAVAVEFDFDLTLADSTEGTQVTLNPYHAGFKPYVVVQSGSTTDDAHHTLYSGKQQTAYFALEGHRRVVGMGLKVVSREPLESRAGDVIAALTQVDPSTSASSGYPPATVKMHSMFDKKYSLIIPDDGCQVRWQPFDRDSCKFVDNTSYTPNGDLSHIDAVPTINISGYTDGDVVNVTAIIHYEYVPVENDLMTGTPSPFGMRTDLLIAACAQLPFTASGHSFVKWLEVASRVGAVALQLLKVGAPIVAAALV